jgi:hypothetical protein
VALLPFQIQPLIDSGIQIIAIELKVIPTFFLGLIHRTVRILQQGIDRLSINPKHRDSHTDCDEYFSAFDQEGIRQHFYNSACNCSSILHIAQIREKHRKLIAAQSLE